MSDLAVIEAGAPTISSPALTAVPVASIEVGAIEAGAPTISSPALVVIQRWYATVDGTFLVMARDLSPAAVRVYLWLSQHCYEIRDTCYPGTDRLSKLTGLVPRTVERARDELREVGMIETWQESPGGVLHYRLGHRQVAFQGTEVPTLASAPPDSGDGGSTDAHVGGNKKRKNRNEERAHARGGQPASGRPRAGANTASENRRRTQGIADQRAAKMDALSRETEGVKPPENWGQNIEHAADEERRKRNTQLPE